MLFASSDILHIDLFLSLTIFQCEAYLGRKKRILRSPGTHFIPLCYLKSNRDPSFWPREVILPWKIVHLEEENLNLVSKKNKRKKKYLIHVSKTTTSCTISEEHASTKLNRVTFI